MKQINKNESTGILAPCQLTEVGVFIVNFEHSHTEHIPLVYLKSE